LYLNLSEKYKNKILLEVAGHDHCLDLRVTTSPTTGEIYRPLLIGGGVTLNDRQLSGFSTFKITRLATRAFDLK